MSNPKCPAGLGGGGRRLWRSVVEAFELEEHELAMLREACHVTDTCARLQSVVDEEGMFELNARGERKMHPALIELRQQRIVQAKILVALRVPLGDAEEGGQQRPQLRSIRGLNAPSAGTRMP